MAKWKPKIRESQQAGLADALLWDVIGSLGYRVPVGQGRGVIRIHLVVRFQRRYYLASGNPWPGNRGDVTHLLARPDDARGDLRVYTSGLVYRTTTGEMVGVQDDIEPVSRPEGMAVC